MKSLFLLIIIVIATLRLPAQFPIVINKPDMPFVPCYYHPVAATTAGISVPAIGTDMTWDYGMLIKGTIYSNHYAIPNHPLFPSATLVDSNNSIMIIPNWFYYLSYYYGETSDYFAAIGSDIEEQHYNLFPITGGQFDSAIIIPKTNIYSSPAKILAYPATMGSVWRSS